MEGTRRNDTRLSQVDVVSEFQRDFEETMEGYLTPVAVLDKSSTRFSNVRYRHEQKIPFEALVPQQPFNLGVHHGAKRERRRAVAGYFILGESEATCLAERGGITGLLKCCMASPSPIRIALRHAPPLSYAYAVFSLVRGSGRGARSPYMCSEGEGGIG